MLELSFTPVWPRLYECVLCVLVLIGLGEPTRAHADDGRGVASGQSVTRAASKPGGVHMGMAPSYFIGGGRRLAPASHEGPLLESGLGVDLLLRPASEEVAWALGPALELRTANARTLAVGAGAKLRWRLVEAFGLFARVTAGRSFLPDRFAGGYVRTTMGAGLRASFFADDPCERTCFHYEHVLDAYVSHTAGVSGRNDARSVTGGVQVDVIVFAAALALAGSGGLWAL